MLQDFRLLIANTLNVSIEQVNDELTFQSIPEWNSLNHVSLMIALEQAYGHVIDSTLLTRLTSVRAIRDYVQQLQPSSTKQELPLSEHNTEKVILSRTSSTPQMTPGTETKVYRGLDGVYFDYTKISHIDGLNGKLYYRGYTIDDLVEFSTFEETSYLLLNGQLPTKMQLENFSWQLRAGRKLPIPVLPVIQAMSEAHPLDALRTAVSMLATFDPPQLDTTPEETKARELRLIAQLPTIVAAHHRYRFHLPIIEPHPTLSHAANFLYMLFGEEPLDSAVHCIETNLILYADHSANASTFTARIATSTQVDLYASITAAIATFSGPLHGGAVEHAMRMLQEIKWPEQVPEYVRMKRERLEPIMGFGHRVYRTTDPRARHMHRMVEQFCTQSHETRLLAILDTLIQEMEPYTRHGVNVNVDFYAGILYTILEIPLDLSTPIFVLGRIAGWLAQIREQRENNILIRPLLKYTGESGLRYQPAE